MEEYTYDECCLELEIEDRLKWINISECPWAGVWGLRPQQALRSAGGQFMNEVSELRRRHIVKACLSSKRIRALSRQARDFRAARIWTWELNSTIGLCLTAIGV